MYPRNEDEFAVITGASTGLGAAFAEACAERGWNLVLAALPGEGLREFSEKLEARRGIRVLAAELDLSRPEDQRALTDLAARLVHERWKKSLRGLASVTDAPWYFRRDEVA